MVTDATDKSVICRTVLRALPEWFGIEQATLGYIEVVRTMDTVAAYAADNVCGFISLAKPNPYSAEIHVMGVLPHLHGRGVGMLLVEEAERLLVRGGYRFLQVKTLSPSRKNLEYELTRQFYRKIGFVPLEEFPTLWGNNNPCLQMIKALF